jgi:hypothetical protein
MQRPGVIVKTFLSNKSPLSKKKLNALILGSLAMITFISKLLSWFPPSAFVQLVSFDLRKSKRITNFELDAATIWFSVLSASGFWPSSIIKLPFCARNKMIFDDRLSQSPAT